MTEPTMRVEHARDRSRYELFVDGQLAGVADYRAGDDGVLVFPHTEIDRTRRGQGLGAVLVKAALDDVQARDATIDARCWYVAQFIDENPEYRTLLRSASA
jgi:uncharacterized protein